MQRTITALGAAVLALTSQTALAGGNGWRITESSGQVSILRSGAQPVAVRRGATLETGDMLVTGAGGRAVVVRDQQFLMVAPNSRLRLPGDPKATGMTRIVEEAGSVIYRIRKRGTPHFRVETPYLAAVVKGTTFGVTVTDKGASVHVVEGAVEVTTLDGAARDLVEAGEAVAVHANDRERLKPDLPPSAAEVAEGARVIPAVHLPEVQLAAVTGGLIAGELGTSELARQTVTPTPAAVVTAPVEVISNTTSGGTATPAQTAPAPAPGPAPELGSTPAPAPTPAPTPEPATSPPRTDDDGNNGNGNGGGNRSNPNGNTGNSGPPPAPAPDPVTTPPPPPPADDDDDDDGNNGNGNGGGNRSNPNGNNGNSGPPPAPVPDPVVPPPADDDDDDDNGNGGGGGGGKPSKPKP